MTNNTPTDGGKPKYNPQHYLPFGDQADYAFQQGWKPTMMDGGAVTYRNQYAPAFDGVMINNQPTGHLEIVGNKNGLFDVQVNKGNGTIDKIMTQEPFSKVDNYFRNNKSIIQQRMSRMQQDPNTQQQQYAGIQWNQ